ncbi:MAG: pyrroline-5-carboxylate reductase, partial [Comamonadaceae bacterium]
MSDVLPPILLIGGGKMGGAMLSGWCEGGVSHCVVIDPAGTVDAATGVDLVRAAADVPAGFRPAAVVLAVKPQVAAQAVPQAAHAFG